MGSRRLKICRLLPLTLAALSSYAGGQEARLRVEVQSHDGAVLGAEVRAAGRSQKSGPDGVANLTVPLGALVLEVSKEGFFPATHRLDVNQAREWIVRVELKEAGHEEEEITVFATRTDTRIQDLPLRVEVLAREEIEEKMLMSPGDIVMMLNETGGLRVQTTSPSLGAASVRVQGMRGRYTRFLSDGLPLFGQQGAGLGLLQIPPMDLGQVEVVKGTASALYGAGAMAGVVNLLARRPRDEPVREFLVNQTTLGGTDVTGFLAGRLARGWSGSLLGGGHWQQRQDRDSDGWADLAAYSRGLVRPRFYWDGGEGRTALLTGGFTYEDRTGGTLPGSVLAATGAPYLESMSTKRSDVGGSFQSMLAGKYVLSGRAAVSEQVHDHLFGDVRERDRHELVFGEMSVRGTAGRNTWVAGVAVERDAYRPRDVPRFEYTYVSPGVFLQDDIDIASWLSLSASARVDFHSEYGTFFSPRVSALLRWEGWTSRISAGQGFYAPTPLTEETEAAGLTRLAVPAKLSPERGRGGSVDLTRQFGPASATATFFASDIRTPVYVRREGAYQLINLPQPTRNRGLELLGTWRKAPFAATASYTFVNSSESGPEGARAEVPLTPRHSFGLVAMWEQEGKFRVGAEWYYTGVQRLEADPYRTQSRAYSIFGLMGERRFGKYLRLFLNLENLTNVRQTRWGTLLRPARGVDGRWTVDAWAPLDGRVINGGVRLVF